ncbi:hypothetical protein [Streptomyces poonensis]|uniref:Uncharacterized protein n=1 Tax=Streptomyces poonensis TaxID=68255 RepID=A0A918URV0_9ACTN|nr:hypothetical protein [Streptomyces poonensis]GGZ29643.1 hypothetical protein GCM10010365_57510 [Streptomyces poonensis]
MSRTDSTKPLWVRYAEHNPQPIHDHRFGPCDLPPAPIRDDPGTRCQWEHPAMQLFYGGNCCAGCKRRSHIRERQQWAKADNRRERYAGRREARRFAHGEYTD